MQKLARRLQQFVLTLIFNEARYRYIFPKNRQNPSKKTVLRLYIYAVKCFSLKNKWSILNANVKLDKANI